MSVLVEVYTYDEQTRTRQHHKKTCEDLEGARRYLFIMKMGYDVAGYTIKNEEDHVVKEMWNRGTRKYYAQGTSGEDPEQASSPCKSIPPQNNLHTYLN